MYSIKYPWYEARRFSTIREMLDTLAESRADAVAFEFRDGDGVGQKTRREFREEVACLGAALGERGLAGAHVSIMGKNSYEWILAFFAVACGGAVAVPVNYTLPREMLLGQIAHSDAAAIVFDEEFASVAEETGVKRLIAMTDIPALVDEGRQLLGKGRRGLSERAPKAEDTALIMYTSGTTGLAGKAVVFSHGLVMRNAYALARTLSFGHKHMSMNPLFFSGGILFGTIMPMAQETALVVNRGALEMYADMRLFKPATSVMVPMILSGILKRTAGMSGEEMRRFLGGKLEAVITGATPTDPAMLRRFAESGIRALIAYGLTEIGGVIACLRNEQESRPGSVGMPLADISVRIDNPDDAGNGEVLIHADYAMKEYYKNPAATREALRDGWLHTGDIGRFDEDGYLYITGRIKNLIILSNGENISPEELEGPLGQSEHVAECLVHEDRDMIVATIYPGEEYLDETKYSREELMKLLYADVDVLNAGVSASRRIGKIILADKPLPKVGAGKIRRL